MEDKTIELRQHEYDRLLDLANLSESQIKEKALDMYRERGASMIDITIKMDIDNGINRYLFIPEFSWSGIKDSFASESERKELCENINQMVLKAISSNYGEPLEWLNEYSRKMRIFKMTMRAILTFAISGWLAFIVCLYRILNQGV